MKKPTDKNKPRSSPSATYKHYSTRQMMEFTERRRTEMLEAGKAELAAVKKKTEETAPPPIHEPLAPAPISETTSPIIEQTERIDSTLHTENIPVTEHIEKIEDPQPSFPDAKTAAQFFRENPETPKEKEIADVIEHQWNLAAQDIALTQEQEIKTIDDQPQSPEPTPLARIPDIAVLEEKPAPVSIVQKKLSVNKSTPVLRNIGLTASMSALFFLMFYNILKTGSNTTVYDQGPYLLVIAAICFWSERDRLIKRKRASWPWMALCVCGAGIFSLAMTSGLLYWELAGLILSTLAVFFGIYTNPRRIVFPLAYLFFVIPPPDSWADAAAPWLNSAVIYTGNFFLYCANIPSSIQGLNLNIASYQISLDGNVAVFYSVTAFAALAALYIHIQNTTLLGKCVLALSVIPLVIVGSAVHAALTGWVAFNYGFEYAQVFFQEFLCAVTFICAFIGLAILAALWEKERAV